MKVFVPLAFLICIGAVILGVVITITEKNKINKKHSQNLQYLNSIGFSIEKQVIASSGAIIMIDYTKRWAALEYFRPNSGGECSDLKVFALDRVVESSLIQDGTVVHRNAIAPAMVGAALFGLGGALAGATAMANESQVGVLAVRLLLDDNQNSSIMIRILKGSISKASTEYQNAYYSAQEIYGLFESIVRTNEEERKRLAQQATDTSSARAAIPHDTVIEQIGQLARLRDDGIISNEEFEAKKNKLMDMI